jgi:hypothetical protein
MDPDDSPTAPTVPPMVNIPVTVASIIGSKIFQFYSRRGLLSEEGHFYYDPAVDLSFCGLG